MKKVIELRLLKKMVFVFFCFVFNEADAQDYQRFSGIPGSTVVYSAQQLSYGGYVIYNGEYLIRLDSNLQQVWYKTPLENSPSDWINNPITIYEDSAGNFYTPWSTPDLLYFPINVVKFDSAGIRLNTGLDILIPAYDSQPWRDFNFDKKKNRILLVYDYDSYDSNQNLLSHVTRFKVVDLDFNLVFSRSALSYFEKVFVLYDNNDSQSYMLMHNNGQIINYDSGNNFLWSKKYSLNPQGAVRKDSCIYFISGNVIFKTDLNGNVQNAVSLQIPFNKGQIEINASGNLVVAKLQGSGFYIAELDTAFNVIHCLVDSSLFGKSVNMVEGTDDMVVCGSTALWFGNYYIEKLNFNTYCGFVPYNLQVLAYSLTDTTLSDPNFTGHNFYTSYPWTATDSTFYAATIQCPPLSTTEQERNTEKIIIIPNPASTQFNISGISFQKGDVLMMMDAVGKTIYSKQFTSNEKNHTVNTSGIAAGVYFMHVKTEKAVYSCKVVVQ